MIELALTAQILLWAIVLLVFLTSGQASVYHPLGIYLLFHLIVFVLRPVLVLECGFEGEWRYMMLVDSERQIYRALAVSSVGLLVFALCSLMVGRTPLQFRSKVPLPFTPEQRYALITTTLILCPVIIRSITALTGGQSMIENRGGTFVMTAATGYTLEAQYMAGPLVCAWLCLNRFRWQGFLVLFLYVGYRSYVGWSRWTILLLFIAVSLAYGLHKRTRWYSWQTVLAVIPILAFFSFLGSNRGLIRDYMTTGSFTPQDLTVPGMSRFERVKAKYDGPDFANFDFLTYVVSMVPERTGTFTYGTQYLQLFTEPIPRKLWPGKPAGAPIGFFNLNNYGNFIGLTVSLVGDGWMSGGWVGVILTMGVVGALCGLAHRWFWPNTENNLLALVYVMALPMSIQWFRDGGISIAKFLFWNLSPLILWVAITWLLAPRYVRACSVLVRPGSSLRLLQTRGAATTNPLPGLMASAASRSDVPNTQVRLSEST
jgi:hypothetical protein